MPNDKGGLFTFGYWRLSYRGRFLFDLWMTPIGLVLAAAIIWWWHRPADITGYWFVALLALIGVASATNNYLRWQAEARVGRNAEKP